MIESPPERVPDISIEKEEHAPGPVREHDHETVKRASSLAPAPPFE
jgi:hypothetical protein